MSRLLFVLLCLATPALLPAQPLIFPLDDNPVQPAPPPDIPQSVIEKVDASVVSIQHEHAGGTGFIISKDGYLLTNGHVVRGDDAEQPMQPAEHITVILHDDRKFPAQVLGFSMDPDVAVLKINTGFDLRPVEFADSREVSVGQRCFAVGTPVGLKRTFTSGILSNIERTDLATETVVFQTDAAINSGNSGGPLFDRQGRVLGINTYASRGRNNLGFTLPIHVALDMVDDLKTRGRFVRSLLPLYFTSELYDELARTLGVEEGVLITYVLKGSSAYESGLRAGDILVEINGDPVSARTRADLLDLEWNYTVMEAGEPIRLTVLRGAPGDRERLSFEGILEELPPMPAFGRHAGELNEHRYATLGLGVEKLVELHHIIHEIPVDTDGVFVKTVREGSVASRADLEPRDVITRVNDRAIPDLETFRAALDEALAAGEPVIELEVVRRKIRLRTGLAPDYLMKNRTVLLIVPAERSEDVDLMRRELLAKGATVRIATPGGVGIPRPELGVPLEADLTLEEARDADADVVLFAGGEGAGAFRDNPAALGLVRTVLNDEKRTLAAVGPSALLPVLAGEEKLDRKLTLPRGISGEAVARGATYTGKDVESDGNLITTTGRERSVLREFLQTVAGAGLR